MSLVGRVSAGSFFREGSIVRPRAPAPRHPGPGLEGGTCPCPPSSDSCWTAPSRPSRARGVTRGTSTSRGRNAFGRERTFLHFPRRKHRYRFKSDARGVQRESRPSWTSTESAETWRTQRRHRLRRWTRVTASDSHGRLRTGVDPAGRARLLKNSTISQSRLRVVPSQLRSPLRAIDMDGSIHAMFPMTTTPWVPSWVTYPLRSSPR